MNYFSTIELDLTEYLNFPYEEQLNILIYNIFYNVNDLTVKNFIGGIIYIKCIIYMENGKKMAKCTIMSTYKLNQNHIDIIGTTCSLVEINDNINNTIKYFQINNILKCMANAKLTYKYIVHEYKYNGKIIKKVTITRICDRYFTENMVFMLKNKELIFINECISGNTEYICNEINKIDINYSDEIYGKTCLHYACENKNMNVVSLILTNNKVDINRKDNNGKTAFMIACAKGDINIISILLQYNNIDIKLYDKYMLTGFNYACKYNHIEVIKFLLNIDEVHNKKIFSKINNLFFNAIDPNDEKIFNMICY